MFQPSGIPLVRLHASFLSTSISFIQVTYIPTRTIPCRSFGEEERFSQSLWHDARKLSRIVRRGFFWEVLPPGVAKRRDSDWYPPPRKKQQQHPHHLNLLVFQLCNLRVAMSSSSFTGGVQRWSLTMSRFPSQGNAVGCSMVKKLEWNDFNNHFANKSLRTHVHHHLVMC